MIKLVRVNPNPKTQLKLNEMQAYKGYLITKGYTNYSVTKSNIHIFSPMTLEDAKHGIDELDAAMGWVQPEHQPIKLKLVPGTHIDVE
jgi:hypothetical protein